MYKPAYLLCYARAIVPTTKINYVAVDFVDDVEVIRAALRVISRYEKNLIRIEYVRDALEDFIALKTTMHEPDPVGMRHLERKARSFFLEFDMFHDHWKKYFADHPKGDEFKKLFDDETHKAFDTSDNYALATMLRNYITHKADVLQAAFWGGNTLDVGCSKDLLLSDKRFNETKKAIIRRQPAQLISLMPIMTGALEKLQIIQDALMEFDRDEEVISVLTSCIF